MPDSISHPNVGRVPIRNPEAIAEPMQDRIILLQTRTEQYFSLDGVGARLWELSDGQRNLARILAALQHEYDVDETELRADVDELLAELEANQLITWAGA